MISGAAQPAPGQTSRHLTRALGSLAMASPTDILGYDGLRVVVSGASSGMGEATARLLGDLGAEVHVVDVRQPSVSHARYFPTDLSDPAAVARTLDAMRDLGPIDRLFNCAGVPHTLGPLMCMLVNWIGLRQLTEGLLPQIVDGGAIASISSDAGIGYQTNMATVGELLAIDDPVVAGKWCEANPDKVKDGYSFSKECIIVWTMGRALELAESRRIRINCIAPSPTDTAFMVSAIAELGREFIDRFPHALLGGMATGADQAGPLVFLNSALAGVVTGTVLYTDQGFAGGLLSGQLDPSKLLEVPEA
jgi:NAD(P)-dependent dehydrogenase (short-subunit alcohol dehydrogenase family)